MAGIINFGFNLGASAGPLIGGAVKEMWGFQANTAIAACLFLAMVSWKLLYTQWHVIVSFCHKIIFWFEVRIHPFIYPVRALNVKHVTHDLDCQIKYYLSISTIKKYGKCVNGDLLVCL